MAKRDGTPVRGRLEKDFTLLYDLDAAAAQGEADGARAAEGLLAALESLKRGR